MQTSEERESEILELINKGLSNYEIYKLKNASYKMLNRLRKKYGKEESKKAERDPGDARFTYKQIAQWDYLHARYGKKGV